MATRCAASSRTPSPPPKPESRLNALPIARQLATVALAHVGVLAAVYLLLLLGDALFTSYALALRDAVFVSYASQQAWFQRMASDVKAAIAFVVAVSALLQMLLVLWRARLA